MGTRGRPSRNDLALAGIHAIRRPEPPDKLSDEEKEEWKRVVSSMRADWFPPETWALLGQYCRHVATCNHLSQLIEAMRQHVDPSDPLSAAEYNRLVKTQQGESTILANLATRMRLTQQSSYDHKHLTHKKDKDQGEAVPWAA